MRCDEAAEFVSALYDGETVPRAAAEHLGTCAHCQASLKSYADVGVELRRIASMHMPDVATPPVWDKPRWSLTGWWQGGWQMMRVPRFAFALLLAGVVVLASRLAVVEVRAHSEGTVLLLHITPDAGQPLTCALSTTDEHQGVCASIGLLKGSILSYRIKVLRKDATAFSLRFSLSSNPSHPGPHP